MPNHNYTTQSHAEFQEDEIDLRELFATIGRYKWSIFFTTFIITAIVVVFAYRMPKYYKTTTVIEVKPKADEGGGFSLGGAGALLGLAGMSGGSSSIDKDTALLSTYRVNESVLDAVHYDAQYYTYERYRYIELADQNCSISVSDLKITNYKKYGMEIRFEPTSKTSFKLYSPGKISNELLGEYTYNTPINTENFDLVIHQKNYGVAPKKIILNMDKHYIFGKTISKNLSVSTDKTNPFIKISYFDTLPSRGESYVKKLLHDYIDLSIGFEIEDADITLDSLNKQIKEIETKVQKSASLLEKYKSSNKLIAPAAQTEALLKGQAETENQLIQNTYQLGLIKHLISFVKRNKNIDAIAPSLIEFKDEPTITLITKLQELQLEASNLAQEFKPAYPKLKSTRAQIRIIKKKIYSNLLNLQKTFKSKAKALTQLKHEYDTKLSHAPTKEKEMKSIMTDYTLNEKLYAYLLQKRSAAEIKKAEAMSRFRTIEPIYTNPAPAKPKKALIAIVGFITALILSIFMAFFREFLRKA